MSAPTTFTTTITAQTQFVEHLAAIGIDFTIDEFFKRYHAQFDPEQDISFMEYFLKLTKSKGKFIAPHTELVDFGVMTSTQPSDALKKFHALGLSEDKDFISRHMSGNEKSVGRKPKHYILTPRAFKICLTDARRYPGQQVDPKVYSRYFLLLEEVFSLYRDYKECLFEKRMATKDTRIDELIAANREMMLYAKDTNRVVHQLSSKLDSMYDFIGSFAQVTLTMWVGSNVFKAQLESLIENSGITYALRHMKMMFVVAFRFPNPRDPDSTLLTMYFCCTNFNNVGGRIRDLRTRHPGGVMMRSRSVCLISGEINCEISSLRGMSIFPEGHVPHFDQVRKSYTLTLPTNRADEIMRTYDDCVVKARRTNFQGYQSRRDSSIGAEEMDPRVVEFLVKYDTRFFKRTGPMCQRFLDCYSTQRDDGYEYTAPSRRSVVRADLDNQSLTDTMYPLMELHRYLTNADDAGQIGTTIRDNILDRKNAKGLVRLSKAAAKTENVPLSEETLEQIREVEDASSPSESDEE